MKATLIEYNDSGKTLKRTSVDVSFASSNDPPIIEIKLPDRSFRHRSIHLSAKQLLSLIMGRLIEKIDHVSDHSHE